MDDEASDDAPSGVAESSTSRRPVERRLGRFRTPAFATVAVAGAFAAGVVVGGGHSFGPLHAVAESSLTGRAEFATLEKTWELIHEDWADPNDLDDSALIYGAAQGMVAAIGDTGHSTFLDPEAAKAFQEESQGKFVGIGVEVDTRCGQPVVTSTMDGSPARAAGLLPGDVIAEVDHVSTDGIDSSKLRDLILGNAGDKLTLTIDRPSKDQPLQVDVVRQTIDVDPVTWRWLPDQTVQMRISGFSAGVNREVDSALGTIRQQGAKRLIVDLRGNPGGLVPEVIGVASQFLDEGATVYEEQGRDGVAKPVRTVGHSGKWLDLALNVLVDGESASGAEVLAAALHDNGRAQLIGEKTFGTGTVLSTFPQEDGSALVLGTSFWLTPRGEHIWREGVLPDKVVPLEPDAFPSRPSDDATMTTAELAASHDAQLQAAYAAIDAAAPASPVI